MRTPAQWVRDVITAIRTSKEPLSKCDDACCTLDKALHEHAEAAQGVIAAQAELNAVLKKAGTARLAARISSSPRLASLPSTDLPAVPPVPE